MSKKLFLIPLIIVLLSGLVFSGCTSTPAPTPTPSPTPTPTPAPSGPTAQNPLKLIYASWFPREMPAPIDYDPYEFMWNRWLDTIEEQTGRRVVFERYPGESLVKMPDYWDAITKGVCDVGDIHSATVPGQFRMTNAMALPGLFPNVRVGALTVQTLYDEGYLAPEYKGVHPLIFTSNSPAALGNRVRPVHTLDDWKGLKVAVEGEPETSTVKALGAVPVSIPVTEQYIALQRGTVDATWLEIHGQVAFKFNEVAQYQTQAHGGIRTTCFAMNQQRYDSLPADIRAIFDRNTGMLWTALISDRFEANLQRAVKYMEQYLKDKGSPPIYEPTADELAKWNKAWEPVFASEIAALDKDGFQGTKGIARAQELSKRLTGWRLGGAGSD